MKASVQQIKVLVPVEIATAFKGACVNARVSMAHTLTRFMAEYSETAPVYRSQPAPDYSTRRLRRATMKGVVTVLRGIKESEERSRDNTPVNLQGSKAWEKTEEIISILEEVIDSLEMVMVP